MIGCSGNVYLLQRDISDASAEVSSPEASDASAEASSPEASDASDASLGETSPPDAGDGEVSAADASDARACPSSQTECPAGCTDTSIDKVNCGRCGIACTPGEVCSAGTCVGRICATAPENTSVTLTCPAEDVISGFAYGSYGTPMGSCPGPFVADGACNASSSLSVVESLCNGLHSCTFTADNATFTSDPCLGIFKSVAVIALCTAE